MKESIYAEHYYTRHLIYAACADKRKSLSDAICDERKRAQRHTAPYYFCQPPSAFLYFAARACKYYMKSRSSFFRVLLFIFAAKLPPRRFEQQDDESFSTPYAMRYLYFLRYTPRAFHILSPFHRHADIIIYYYFSFSALRHITYAERGFTQNMLAMRCCGSKNTRYFRAEIL